VNRATGITTQHIDAALPITTTVLVNVSTAPAKVIGIAAPIVPTFIHLTAIYALIRHETNARIIAREIAIWNPTVTTARGIIPMDANHPERPA
jgi:hypothetical protein